MAKRIAAHYGKSAKPLKVKMVGAREVRGLMAQIRRARKNSFSKVMRLD
jgi:hypothetical protein